MIGQDAQSTFYSSTKIKYIENQTGKIQNRNIIRNFDQNKNGAPFHDREQICMIFLKYSVKGTKLKKRKISKLETKRNSCQKGKVFQYEKEKNLFISRTPFQSENKRKCANQKEKVI